MSDERATSLGLAPPKADRAADLGLAAPVAQKPPENTAFYGALNLLPQSVQEHLPSFLKGPSALETETASQSKIGQEEQRLGRRLTMGERLKISPAMESPIALGFGTHQIGELPSGIGKNIAAASGNTVNTSFNRAVKPTPTADPKAYQEKMRGAIGSIINNKSNLQFTDMKTGDPIRGELPKTLEQFGEAIDQTKKEIFDRYDKMAQQSGQMGIDVPLTRAELELNTIANDPVTKALHPKEAKYADRLSKGLKSLKTLSPSQIQSEIQKLNSSLNAFYKNPSRKGVGSSAIDAMLANIFREELDLSISSSVAPGYQGLKNEYGALRTIEKDVVHRTQRVANQEAGGGILGRLADVASAEQVLRGIFTLNMKSVAIGTGLKSWAQYMKWRRSPHRAVENMFKTAEQQATAPTGATPPIVPSVPMSPFTLTQQPTALDQAVQQGGTP